MAKKMPKKTITKKHTNPFFKKFLPVLIFTAILSAALFIAAQLAARQAIAPNAPESEPEAAACAANVVNRCGPQGGCVMGKMCQKTGTAIVRSETGNRTVNKYGCVTSRSCSNVPTPSCSRQKCPNGCSSPTVSGGICKPTASPTPYCQNLKAIGCLYGCTPSLTGGTCKPKPVVTPTSTVKECDPSKTLERCKYNQPQVCQNYKWVNNGKQCVNGCAGAGICLNCKQGDTRCSENAVEKCNNGVYVEIKSCKPNKCVIQNGLVQCSSSDRINACIPGDTYTLCTTKGCNGCPADTIGAKCTCTDAAVYSCSCGI